MKPNHLLSAALFAAAATALPSGAQAAINITGISGDPGFQNGTISYTPGGISNLAVGVGRIKLTGTDTVSNANVSFLSYCVDIMHMLHTGTFDINPLQNVLTDVTKQSRLLALVTNADPLIASAANAQLKKDISSAIQLAVWEIAFESSSNPYSLTAGDFRASGVTSNAFSLAGTYLANATSVWTPVPGYGLNVLVANPTGSNQNQLFLVSTPVPEPATWAMMIAGFGLVGGSLRMRSRRPLFSAA